MGIKTGFCFFCIFIIFCTAPTHSDTTTHVPRFERIGPFGGDVRSLLIDAHSSNLVYLGTSNGKIYKSSDGGRSWNALYPGIGQASYVIDTLVQHPREEERLFAGAWDLYSDGGGLFESKDAGKTWALIPLSQESLAVRGIAICRTNPLYMIVGTLAGAFVSADGGHSWNQVGGSRLQKAESVAIDPIDPNLLYVGTWRLGYKSKDFGKSWTRIEQGMPLDSDIFSMTIDQRNPAVIYSSACSGVYRSDNRAQSWMRLRVHPDRYTIRAQVVYRDPVEPRRIYTGTTEGLYVSDNEGRAWKRLTHANITVNAIQVDPANNHRILIGTEYQGVLSSEDEGKTWKECNSGFIHKQISWIHLDSGRMGEFTAGVHSGGGGWYRYAEASSQWTLSQIEPGMRVLSFLELPKNMGTLAGTPQGVYYRAAGSSIWSKMKGSIAKRTIYSLELDAANPVVYAGTDQGIYRSTLSAMEFRIPPGYRLSPKTWCLLSPSETPGVVYAGTSLGLLRSWDRGTTWKVLSAYGLPERVAIETIAVSPSNKDHMFVGTAVGLFESRDGGIYWHRADNGKLSVSISSVVFLDGSGKRLLAADEALGGVHYSTDSGEHWEKLFERGFESPIYCIVRDPVKPDRVYMGTRWDGVYRLTLP